MFCQADNAHENLLFVEHQHRSTLIAVDVSQDLGVVIAIDVRAVQEASGQLARILATSAPPSAPWKASLSVSIRILIIVSLRKGVESG